MSWLIALLLAKAALGVNAPNNAAEFTRDFTCTNAVVEWGTFVGCEDRTSTPDDETGYAGLIWIDNQMSLETGP